MVVILAEIVGLPGMAARLREIQSSAPPAIMQAMQRLSLQLVAHVAKDKLTGQVLHVKTGKLRRSITLRLTESSSEITSIVGTNTEYAAAHEFGFRGEVNVREYLRRTKASTKAAMGLGWAKSAAKQVGRSGSLGAGMVRGHKRKMNMPERSFLRSALTDMAPTIQTTLRAAMEKVIRGEK